MLFEKMVYRGFRYTVFISVLLTTFTANCSKKEEVTITYDSFIVNKVKHTVNSEGKLVRDIITKKGLGDNWDTPTYIYTTEKSRIEEWLGFPLYDYGNNAEYAVLKTPAGIKYAEWLIIETKGDNKKNIVFPLDENAVGIQGGYTIEKQRRKYEEEISKIRGGKKYDASFDAAGNFRVRVITPLEWDVYNELEKEFAENPEPDPEKYFNDDAWIRANERVENRCLSKVGSKYGLKAKTVKDIYAKVGMLLDKQFSDS